MATKIQFTQVKLVMSIKPSWWNDRAARRSLLGVAFAEVLREFPQIQTVTYDARIEDLQFTVLVPVDTTFGKLEERRMAVLERLEKMA